MNIQDWFPLGWTGWISLKSLPQHHSSKASILHCSALSIVQLSHPYMTTGKTIALTRLTFVSKALLKILLIELTTLASGGRKDRQSRAAFSVLSISFLPTVRGILLSILSWNLTKFFLNFFRVRSNVFIVTSEVVTGSDYIFLFNTFSLFQLYWQLKTLSHFKLFTATFPLYLISPASHCSHLFFTEFQSAVRSFFSVSLNNSNFHCTVSHTPIPSTYFTVSFLDLLWSNFIYNLLSFYVFWQGDHLMYYLSS